MELSLVNMAITFTAGLASVASPCVLPVIPIVITGTEKDHKYRPLLIVAGLSLTFTAMGVLSSLFGSLFADKMRLIEQIAGIIIILFGLLMIADLNFFKKLAFLQNMNAQSKGRFSGLFLGVTLGIIWIPCIGPVLSSVLAMVASQANIERGIILLLSYSMGFAVPMLIAGYSSSYFRNKIGFVKKYPRTIRWLSGGLLIALGILILTKGLIFLSVL
jgi:cytochrome c-type biogenesis protein